MNTLKYIDLDDAAKKIDSGKTIPDGTVIIAHMGDIERRQGPTETVLKVESHIGSTDWYVRWTDGTYHYQILVARQGIEDVFDARGEDIGFRVVGSPGRYDVCANDLAGCYDEAGELLHA